MTPILLMVKSWFLASLLETMRYGVFPLEFSQKNGGLKGRKKEYFRE